MSKPCPVVHFEIGCQHLDKTKSFYSSLFGWSYVDGMPNMGMVSNLGPFAENKTEGIGGHIHAMGHPPHQYVTFYVQVDDIAATLKRAEAMGGSTLVPTTEVPGMGHFAWMKDPEGNCIGLWKHAPR